MAKRKPMSRKKSKKLFKRTAQRVHPKNALGGSSVMRGGIRF